MNNRNQNYVTKSPQSYSSMTSYYNKHAKSAGKPVVNS